MKTQISELRSGTKNQHLNSSVDYSLLPKASSHIGHSGSSSVDVMNNWNFIIKENEKEMKIEILGFQLFLTANWSVSKKSCFFYGTLPNELAIEFGLVLPKEGNPSITICNGNTIMVHNGKKYYRFLCPSFIKIL